MALVSYPQALSTLYYLQQTSAMFVIEYQEKQRC